MVKLRARCLLAGDAAVGKSSLSHIFYSDGSLFQKNYSMTTGVELLVKSVSIPETNDTVELYILDTPGKDTLVDGCEKMWGEPSLLCLVFDLTNEQSFVNCGGWMERVRAHCQGLHVPDNFNFDISGSLVLFKSLPSFTPPPRRTCRNEENAGAEDDVVA
ncbi:intraflagellar transport protein 27 homolog isoform X2 [Kryptolebias marmoratus]|uniref:intraflagellar transport protein 27 homolog isoform X2 n=1 Tax=Kryptolebias marmoratus TaxID=37003 RepID=UPI0007F93FA2|nr:intraflagellar transport protein 27 homolog isoform X2 [Kryptolebias marmoratus]